MKTRVPLFLRTLLCVCTFQTMATALAADPTLTGTVAVASNYVYRGLQLSGAAVQPNLEYVAGNFTAGAWANLPFNGDAVAGSVDPEFDLYSTYTLPLSSALSLVPGVTAYHFPHAPSRAGFYRATFEPNVALAITLPSLGVRVSPKIYYDVVRDGPTYELNAYYAYPLSDLGSELDFTASVGSYKWRDASRGAAPAVTSWGDYWLVGISAPFQVSPRAKVVAGFTYTEGRDAFTRQGNARKRSNPAAASRGVVTLSYAYSF